MAARVSADDEVKTDMTPMIDCVFLLIVFFVCIDFRTLEAKLPAYLPKHHGSSSRPLEPEAALRVRILPVRAGERVFADGTSATGARRMVASTNRPERFLVRGHRVQWQVGPTLAPTAALLASELVRIHADRSTWQEYREQPGRLRPLRVVVEPQQGVWFDDVTATADAVRAAGFPEVEFAAGVQ